MHAFFGCELVAVDDAGYGQQAVASVEELPALAAAGAEPMLAVGKLIDARGATCMVPAALAVDLCV